MQEALRKLKDYRKQLADRARSAVLEEHAERLRAAEDAVLEAIRIVQESPASDDIQECLGAALGLGAPLAFDLGEMIQMVKSDRGALATTIKERNDAEADRDRLASEVDRLTKERDDLRDAVKELHKREAMRGGRLAAYIAEQARRAGFSVPDPDPKINVHVLAEQLIAVTKERDDLDKMVSGLSEERDRLAKRIHAFDGSGGEREGMEDTIRGLEADRDRLTFEVDRLTKERGDVIAIIEWVDAEALRRSDETCVEALQRLIDGWRAEADRLARKADDLAMDKADLEGDREDAERDFAKERETWRANVERLTAENNRLQREIGEACNRMQAEQLERERASHEQEIADLRDRIGLALGLERPRLLFLGEMIHEVERMTRGRDDARTEIARLRGILRQMIREEAERRIEALGVGEEAPE